MNSSTASERPATPWAAHLFFTTSLIFLVLAMLMLAGRPNFLATPVLTGHGLSWLLMLVFGAGFSGVFGLIYRAIPESFGAKLYSEKIVLLHFAFHLAGTLLVLASVVWTDFDRQSMGTTLVMAGAICCGVNLAGTFGTPARPDLASAHLAAGTLWLVVSSFLGVPFISTPALTSLQGSSWSEGWLVLALAGVLVNIPMGLALRVTPGTLGIEQPKTGAAWYALFFFNGGLAWMFPAVAFRTPGFLLLCSAVLLVGLLVYLAVFHALLQRPARRPAGWEERILLTSLALAPVAVFFLASAAWGRLTTPPPAEIPGVPPPVVEEKLGPLPVDFLPADAATVLVALLAVGIPALVAVGFQLSRITEAASANNQLAGQILLAPPQINTCMFPPRANNQLAGQILLAAYFNYATGVLLLVPGAWLGIEKMLGLGSLFLLVGVLGFLGNYLFNPGKKAAPESPQPQGAAPA